MADGQIYKLIPKIMAEIGAVGKEGKNEQQGYKFRSIEDVMNAAHPVLAKYGVFIAPEVIEKESQDRQTFNRNGEAKTSIRVSLSVRHTWYASDGSSVPVVTVGEGIDSSDKASNKAMTAAFKYTICETLCIPTKDLSEGDLESPDAGEKVDSKPSVPVTTEEIPLDRMVPPAEERITKDQALRIHKRFEEELRPELRKDAKKFLHDFLGLNLYLDENGNPSADAIPKQMYAQVGKSAVAFAKSL